jgi:hypothetical protein
MARFFFNVAKADVTDRVGEEFSSDRAARKDAVESVREILSEGARSGWDMTDWTMTVTDKGGKILFELPVWPSGKA